MASFLVQGAKPPEPGHALRVNVSDTPVALFNVNGQLLAVEAKCTHVGGPLDQGPVHEATVTCPWHGSQFELASGKVVRGPATRPVRAYRVTVQSSGLEFDPL